MDAARALARNIVKLGYDELPPEVINVTKNEILDTLGTAIAGSTATGVREVAGLIQEWGGKQESTLIAFDGAVPSPSAALVNATMAHALDYDDIHMRAGVHGGIVVVPASFAIAERRGKVTGKEFITAVALAIDLMCRMGIASKMSFMESGWIHTSIYGSFGAAAAAGKILRLNEEKIVNAFGIAYSQTAGNAQCIEDAVLTKRVQPGFAAKAGVLSALLAERGITGAQSSIEGRFGMYNVYHRSLYDPLPLTSNLTKLSEVNNISFKPYPSCRYTHASIDATLELVHKYDIKPDDVEEINITTGEKTQSEFEPLERKRRPQTIPDAQFSIPYTVATAVVKRKLRISDFTLDAIGDPRVLQIASRVKPRIVPELTQQRFNEPAIVEIRTKTDNAVYSERVDNPKGDPENPMTLEELADKFRDCASHGKEHLSKQEIENGIQLVSNLEEVKDVAEVIQLFG